MTCRETGRDEKTWKERDRNRNEIEIAAALGAHERSISEQDNGFFLSEWIGASTKKNVDFCRKKTRVFSCIY